MHIANKIGWRSAAAIVVANMIGTGVFTTLGFQLEQLGNTWTILLLWALGGLMAFLGALSYAEIGSRLPKSGGEYHYLSEIYHPLLGYLSGWVSITVGFAASIALAAMAIGNYLAVFGGLHRQWVAALAIVVIALIHSFNIQQSSLFQNALTALKLLLVLGLIGAGLWISPSVSALDWSGTWRQEVWQPAFAVSLVYVSYAFSGWNAAAYITGEIEQPTRNLPRALLGGAALVSVLYVLLQLVFLRQAPADLLRGKVEVGQVVAQFIFGPLGGQVVSLLIAGLLTASISAMIWVGPRVIRAMANDYRIWQYFARDNSWGIPVRAIWLQTGISLLLVITSSFEQVLLYSGFILQLFTTITVAGLFRLRRRQGPTPGVFLSPAYPWAPLIFLAFSGWILVFLLIDKPFESLLGLLNLLAGALSYAWNRFRFQPDKPIPSPVDSNDPLTSSNDNITAPCNSKS